MFVWSVKFLHRKDWKWNSLVERYWNESAQFLRTDMEKCSSWSASSKSKWLSVSLISDIWIARRVRYFHTNSIWLNFNCRNRFYRNDILCKFENNVNSSYEEKQTIREERKWWRHCRLARARTEIISKEFCTRKAKHDIDTWCCWWS